MLPDDPRQSAEEARLRYVSCDDPGFSRRRKGSGFVCYDTTNKAIRAADVLKRIRSLAIPPAWEEVWICRYPNGHLQATGIDSKGRRQYKYHETWRTIRDEAKYERLASFARALPRIRARLDKDLRLPGLPKQKVVAAVIKLLQTSLIRVGNEQYAKANNSFGLTTMRNRHVKVDGASALFKFRGKSAKKHEVKVTDRRLATIVRKCQELPGQQLFEYVSEEGEYVPVGSEDVNEYLQSVSNQPFTAKDFRTWAGTVLASLALSEMQQVDNKAAAKKNVLTAVEAVAKMLGNTPAICRKCYVHPAVITRYLDGTLAASLKGKADSAISKHLHQLKPEEAAVLGLLSKELARRSA
jgi:DNA topoisomerase I